MPLHIIPLARLGLPGLRVRGAVRAWWRRVDSDDAPAYGLQSVAQVDLPHRIRRWNETDRHARTPRL